ncbi:phosphoribosylanthranilate isomerase [Orrella daihaiensis]|uniref:N-(5'-phosphoribosyl)anthranilate isomerase n=1 Tax=Orrella daihaiensis TaxID=2782176 RepID=A0ABY4AMZ4_9BURK|nr:phosphoribosylanthranilate isomerase [Orrella daihaiensis]UOD49414.1 phosphoribosylanthranilate isomerase [Orrella daihaiensis]
MDADTLDHRRTRIKICGLTREGDVALACELGADALGFVFYPKSRRCLSPERAAQLAKSRDVFVDSVALFVEPSPDLVADVISVMHPNYLQFHGDETAKFCEQFNWPYIKAFRVGAPGLDTPEGVLKTCQQYSSARGWLFDSFTPAYGGSGHEFDRDLLALVSSSGNKPVILSGGLRTDNVKSLITKVRPQAVDVSSGVESEPGVKCPEKMRAFVQAVAGTLR